MNRVARAMAGVVWFVAGGVLAGCGAKDYEAAVASERAALIARIETGEPGEIADAAEGLGRMGTLASPAVPALLEEVRHEDEPVRIAVLEALGKTRDPRAVQPVIDYLSWEKRGNGQALRAACEALGRLGAVEGVVPMTHLIDQGVKREVEIAALTAVGRITADHPNAIPELLRAESAQAFGQGDWWAYTPLPMELRQEIEEVLVALETSEDAGIRNAALRMLDRLGAKAELEDNTPGASEFVTKVSSNNWQLVRSAAFALERHGNAKHVPLLIDALERAVRAEGDLMAERAKDALVDALWAQTGEDFGEVTEAWRTWWREHRDEFGE